MGFIPAWAWRWLAILGVGAALYGAGWLNGRHHEERIFDDYKEQVKLAADKQAFLTAQTIKAHQALKEISDAEAKTRTAERDLALSRVRQLVQAGRDRSLLSAGALSTGGRGELCYPAGELDRQIREALGEAASDDLNDSATGQAAVDTASVCKKWAQGLSP